MLLIRYFKTMAEKHWYVEPFTHLLVLWSFAVAQPLFAILGQKEHSPFLIAHSAKPLDIVLLTAILVLGIPACLLFLEYLTYRISPRLQRGNHGLFLLLLGALAVMPFLKQNTALGAEIICFGAVVIAGVFTILYFRLPDVRFYLSVLSPVLLVFPLLFLFGTPVRKMVFPKQVHSLPAPVIQSETPVLLVVFDELPLTSLLDEHGRIDALRYPNFARLSVQATWYRNASTVADRTSFAVPIIFSGILPHRFRHGTYQGYPDNLFTLLGGSYRLNVVESITSMCPEYLCRDRVPSFAKRFPRLLADTSLLYPHVVLPKDWTAALPAIDQDWANFGGAKQAKASRRELINQFLASMRPGQSIRSLYALHVELPHSPWVYLPSGVEYDDDLEPAGMLGLDTRYPKNRKNETTFWHNEWAAIQGFQRHLLQVGYVDRVLGDILERLKQIQIYDKALIVVVADHGFSFGVRGEVRAIDAYNFKDIMSIPLLVKYPNQQEGQVSDVMAQTVDILPTIADVLGVQAPWKYDGASLLQKSFPNRQTLTLYDRDRNQFTVETSRFLSANREMVNKLRLFGAGGSQGLYRIGSAPELLGLPPQNCQNNVDRPLAYHLLNEHLLDKLDLRNKFRPIRILGEIVPGQSSSGLGEYVDVALALNQRLVALSKAYRPAVDKNYRFFFMVPEEAFVQGKNAVSIYRIRQNSGHPQLEQMQALTH